MKTNLITPIITFAFMAISLFSSCNKEPLPLPSDDSNGNQIDSIVTKGNIISRDSALQVVYNHTKVGLNSEGTRIFASKDTISSNSRVYLNRSYNYPAWIVIYNKIHSRAHHYCIINAYTSSIEIFQENDWPSNLDTMYDELRVHGVSVTNTSDNTFMQANSISAPTPSNSNNNKWAVIVNATHSPQYNYLRFWNDCAGAYRMLVNKYGYSDNQIYTLISDGTSSANDRYIFSGYDSSPLDLDGDGDSDIDYAATAQNLTSVLTTLRNSISNNDHVLLFITGYGTKDTLINLWNNTSISQRELKTLLHNLNSKANLHVVMGQGYGGRLSELEYTNFKSYFLANGYSEASVSREGNQYSEKIYLWLSAACGQTPEPTNSINIDSDINDNGIISYCEIAQNISEPFTGSYVNKQHLYEDGLFGTWITGFPINDINGEQHHNAGEYSIFSITNLTPFQTVQWQTSSGLTQHSASNTSLTISNTYTTTTFNQWVKATVTTSYQDCDSSHFRAQSIPYTFHGITFWNSYDNDGTNYITGDLSYNWGTFDIPSEFNDCSNFVWTCSIPEWECHYQGYRYTEFSGNNNPETYSEVVINVAFQTPTGKNMSLFKTFSF